MPFFIGLIVKMSDKILRTNPETFSKTQNIFERMFESYRIGFAVQYNYLRISYLKNTSLCKVAPAIDEDYKTGVRVVADLAFQPCHRQISTGIWT